jgi:hypothetical protein
MVCLYLFKINIAIVKSNKKMGRYRDIKEMGEYWGIIKKGSK